MWLGVFHLVATISMVAAALECHPQGPILPRPRHLSKSPTFQAAARNLTDLLDSAFAGKLTAGFVTANVSVSVSLVSLDQTSPGIPAWEYHHTAENTENGTTMVDRDSLYMIASVSKAISDAIFIKSGVPAGDAITKYVPELASKESRIDWSVITMGMLGSHLGGIPPNYGFSEYYYLKDYFEYLGFPRINESDYLTCGVNTLSDGCTREQFLKGLLTLAPVSAPNTHPVYSNIAFTLLIYAVRAYTSPNATYPQLLHDLVTAPLNMSNTFISGNLPPSGKNLSSQAVIPPVPNNFNATTYGDDAPGGGLVSSLGDLSSFVHSIISHSIFGSDDARAEARVREWLQPKSFLGSPNTFLGQPWEIYRPPPEVLFPGKGEREAHTVTFVSKDGSAYGYRSRIVMVDEYGVGFVVLVAGDPDALEVVYGAVASTLIPAVDEVAREEVGQTEGGYVGGYSNSQTSYVPVEVKFDMIDGGSTLGLIELKRNGSDLVQGLEDAWTYSLGWFLPGLRNSGIWRLYPSELAKEAEEVIAGKTVTVVREDWRLWWDVEPVTKSDLPGRELVAGDCSSWSVTDWVYYGGEAIDRVVFVKDKDTGHVLGVDFPFLRTGVVKKV
ncbi:beta-lactamase-like protein 2 [Rhypophila decipiens]|uniref:Beta-lactamase-like protein 2 n=1 Tax=Rhypophila decipiens TaxID=261697 RepID=A0AAN6Y894_9PEZI|nr:beta-lactamase-like protein 2 [Rhypophila decipiens]